jgi:hypothetical protein
LARLTLIKEHEGNPAGTVIEVSADVAANLVLRMVAKIDRSPLTDMSPAPEAPKPARKPKAKK